MVWITINQKQQELGTEPILISLIKIYYRVRVRQHRHRTNYKGITVKRVSKPNVLNINRFQLDYKIFSILHYFPKL